MGRRSGTDSKNAELVTMQRQFNSRGPAIKKLCFRHAGNAGIRIQKTLLLYTIEK